MDSRALLKGAYPGFYCSCGALLSSPVRLSPCGHDVCRACAKQYSSCPRCHTSVDYKKENGELAREIQGSIQICPNYSEDRTKPMCRFRGTMEQLKKHLDEECPNMIVNCPYAKYGCRKQMPRFELDKHIKQCTSAPSKCRYCGQEVSTSGIFRHEKECQTKYSKCSFCGELVLKTRMNEHMESDCGAKPAKCPITYCDSQLKKGELQSHLMGDGAVLKKHNVALARLITETAGGIEEIRNIISELRNSITVKRQRLQQLDEIIAESEQEIEKELKEAEEAAREADSKSNSLSLSLSPSPSSIMNLQDFYTYDQKNAFELLQKRFQDLIMRRDDEIKRLEIEVALATE